jgi:hypothetical protein
VSESTGRAGVPPPQTHFREAASRAAEGLRRQSDEQLAWLGALPAGGRWKLPVLDDVLEADAEDGTVRTSAGEAVSAWWQVLTLHYLSVCGRPADEPPAVTFAELPGGRTYAPVYQQRVIGRLCATVGRSGETLRLAAEALGALPGRIGDLAFEFRVFPRLPLQLVWYGGDAELSPSAVVLLPRNIEAFLCIEDIVVLSERLVSRLSGGRF